jgi:hypothetical protein
MFSLAFLIVLTIVDGCLAIGGLHYIRPPRKHDLVHRSTVESIDTSAIVNVGNTTLTSSPNAAIVPVEFSPDDQ